MSYVSFALLEEASLKDVLLEDAFLEDASLGDTESRLVDATPSWGFLALLTDLEMASCFGAICGDRDRNLVLF